MLKSDVKIYLNGEDLSRNLAGYLVSVTYTDKLSGEADTLECTLMDKNHLFLTDYFPPRGATLSISINDFDLGAFEIDDIDYAAPPSVMKVKANSISQNSGLRQVDESHSWENVLLSKIAKDVADASGVKLFYQTDYDPEIKRAEQGEQSRLDFLDKLCADNGLILKVADNQLIICEEKSLEDLPTVMTLTFNDITRFQANATLNEVYQKCQVNYSEARQDKTFSAEASDPTKSTGRTLKINKRVTTQAEAERLAKYELRKKNKEEFTVNMTLPLNLRLLAGVTVQLDGFGVFSGKWLVDESTHVVSNVGSQSRIKLHRTEAQS